MQGWHFRLSFASLIKFEKFLCNLKTVGII